jgi:hypothetical protein
MYFIFQHETKLPVVHESGETMYFNSEQEAEEYAIENLNEEYSIFEE